MASPQINRCQSSRLLSPAAVSGLAWGMFFLTAAVWCTCRFGTRYIPARPAFVNSVLLVAFFLYFIIRAATAPVVPQPLLVLGLFAGYVAGVALVVEPGVFAVTLAITSRRRSAGQAGGGLATEDGNVAAAYQTAVL